MSLKTITLQKITIPKSKFSTNSELMQKRFIMMSSFLTEIDILVKKFIISFKTHSESTGILKESNSSTLLFFFKTTICKIAEFWLFLKANKILYDKDSFTQDLKEKCVEIETFFSGNNLRLFLFIRNKFGFHYLYEDDLDSKITEVLTEIGDVVNYVSVDNSGNNCFVTTELAILSIITNKMIKWGYGSSDQECLIVLFNLPFKIASECKSFCMKYIRDYFHKDANFDEEFTLDIPIISELRVPNFLANS